ncbi:MAG: DNA integrity scanning protein DisA nucleotide-binding domain protein, partial [Spiroplasma sp.]|nr:DNA integrity scanning protein DisA nucleotide-binding domain protein [Mycoplasmatales bacterium]
QIGTFTNLLKGDKEEFDFVDELTETVYELGEKKTGALICLKRGASLEKYTSKAIHIDSIFSKRLLISIFNKKSVLHDGAVVITNERIAYASTFFPIALDITNDKELGTRHRAALTISKETDSITLIVSEENGKVSVAYEGRLYKELEKTFLKQLLIEKIEGR